MITLKKVNESFGYIDTDDYGLVCDIYDNLSFFVPNYKFTPAYKNSRWDGKIHLVNLATRQFPIGLSSHILEYFQSMNEECIMEKELEDSFHNDISEETIKEFISKYKFYSKSKEIFPREDQQRAIVRSIVLPRSVNICPTSFGKSLCIFIQSLWHIQRGRKIIIIVPTVDLVHQFEADIRDYCTYDGTIMEWFPKIHKIYAGQDKYENADITISTWQSIYKLEKEFINRYDSIILDECHHGSAKSIQDIFNRADNVPFRTGWTGTLNSETIHQLVAEGIMGPIEEIIDTKSLMDLGIVADMTIVATRLRYPEDISKEVLKLDYQTEIKYIEKNLKRNKKICNIALSMTVSGLILYKHIPHGEFLFSYLRKSNPDRIVYLIHGGYFYRNEQKFKKIEDMKEYMETDKDAIIVANYQVFSTGLSVKNIHWIMFASPTKSYIKVIQSIGRGLRVSKTKRKLLLIDIVDDFSLKKRKNIKENYAMKHFGIRFSFYNEKKFKYIVKKINM